MMPIKSYYKGSGKKVMKHMKEEYGEEKGKRIFYMTAHKKGFGPGGKKSKKWSD